MIRVSKKPTKTCRFFSKLKPLRNTSFFPIPETVRPTKFCSVRSKRIQRTWQTACVKHTTFCHHDQRQKKPVFKLGLRSWLHARFAHLSQCDKRTSQKLFFGWVGHAPDVVTAKKTQNPTSRSKCQQNIQHTISKLHRHSWQTKLPSTTLSKLTVHTSMQPFRTARLVAKFFWTRYRSSKILTVNHLTAFYFFSIPQLEVKSDPF